MRRSGKEKNVIQVGLSNEFAIYMAVVTVQNQTRGLPTTFSRVSGSKRRYNYSNPMSSLVQPFLEHANRQSSSGLAGIIHSLDSFSLLNVTRGEIAIPSAQIHSSTVTHSCRPGSFL